MRILMVEDETYMAEAVVHILKKHYYTVDLVDNGTDGLDYGLSGIYDVIILDIMLPEMDGLSVLKELRQNGIDTPIILLTARSNTEDRVTGLDSGADDYLAKPFETEELLARLRALGRRFTELAHNNTFIYGDIEFNQHTLTLCCNTMEVSLTLKEAQLLELLMKRKNMIISKEMMIEKVWGFDTDADDSRVEIHISLLRRKLTQLASSVTIRTIRGAGYLLQTEKDE
ncbi:MAG TPA: response regulator transcription factor [Virgibacillus sp.]|nr:response regulator transcription factor [Virgibacillus sp.]HLR67225.1 response regulator transcription factor [Virgibacillus sp.]